MHPPLFQFGQQLPEYTVPVMNERAVRASPAQWLAVVLYAALVSFTATGKAGTGWTMDDVKAAVAIAAR